MFCVKIMEDTEDGLLTMGRVCLQRGRNGEAMEMFDKALAINPQSAIAWAGKGVALVNMKKHEDALNAFDKSILIDPKVAFAWDGKGMALMGLGRFRDAVPFFEMALSISPSFRRAKENRARAMEKVEGKGSSD